jgi:CDP-2,3-bis-(O-geranylgeranyl)-sn-glycerol synthase
MSLTSSTVDAGACALFLLAAFVLSGCAQAAWLASAWSYRFAVPIDGGRTFRGQRIFGDNKTIRGFVIMVPATAFSFAVLAELAGQGDPRAAGLWALTPDGYAWLGACAALGFMLGELPNSFVKRQLGVAPGAMAPSRSAAVWQFAADRFDSGIGMLAAVSLAVPVPARTWLLVLAVGWAVHWSFSAVLFRLGVKARAA